MVSAALHSSMPVLSWWPDWRDKCCAIVAGGPSAKTAGVEKLQGHVPTIAVNESYRLCPWADVLYACDAHWWKLNNGVPSFKGIKIGYGDPLKRLPDDVRPILIKGVWCDEILLEPIGTIGAGGNSGFQAINLAVQFGALQIMLIGFDMHGRSGDHWHGRHLQPCTNPIEENYRRWIKAIDGAAPSLKGIGVEVINCSQYSHLKTYPKMTVDGAMARWKL